MDWLNDYFSGMEQALLAANILLLVFSRALIKRIFPEHDDEGLFRSRLNLFRAANVIALVIVISSAVMHPGSGALWITRTLGVMLAIYVAWLMFYFIARLIRRRWGGERKRGDETVFVETYNSRLLTLVAGTVISVITLVAVIRIMGYSTLLEAGGVLGVVGVMLAITQSSWVPDLVSGLVILNSRLIDEGDIIQLGEDSNQVGMVFRTKVFFTEILHLANNHRILIQNSKLRGMTVHNLSRFASAKGLRESLNINVSYDVTEQQVNELFHQVMEYAHPVLEVTISPPSLLPQKRSLSLYCLVTRRVCGPLKQHMNSGSVSLPEENWTRLFPLKQRNISLLKQTKFEHS